MGRKPRVVGLNWGEVPTMSLRAGERARNWRKEWKCSVSGKLASQRPKLTIRDKADLEKL